jgi:hypothetical protein
VQVLGVVAEFIATGLGGLGLWDELQVACVECAACACLERGELGEEDVKMCVCVCVCGRGGGQCES